MLAVNTSFSVLSCISFVLVLLSFPWYLKLPYSTGVYFYMAWTSLGCLNLFINSIMWRESMSNLAPLWCDISTKFMTIVCVALPVASMCVCRHLCHLTTKCQSKKVERLRILLDLSIGLGVPAVYALLHILVQRFRFNIFEGYGCVPSVYNTPLAYVIVQAPILAFALVSTIYCLTSLVRFRRIGAENLSEKLSPYWYFRLLCLAATEIILSVAGGIMRIVLSCRGQVIPWVSWGDTHEVVEFPSKVWRADLAHLLDLEEARWTMIARAVVFFALFAFESVHRAFTGRLKMASKDKRNYGCSLPNSDTLTFSSSSSSTVLNVPRSDSRSTTRVELGPPDSPSSATTSESMYSTNTNPCEREGDPVHRAASAGSRWRSRLDI